MHFHGLGRQLAKVLGNGEAIHGRVILPDISCSIISHLLVRQHHDLVAQARQDMRLLRSYDSYSGNDYLIIVVITIVTLILLHSC